MKKVIIPTDFSDNAWDALTYAIRLYDDIPCRFYILNTYEVVATGVNTTIHTGATRKLREILKEDSERDLKKIIDHLEKHLLNDKHKYITRSLSGDLISNVKRLIKNENIDMIVMGTTGATGAKGVFMGSNTVKAIKKIDDCPIISVPAKFEYSEPEDVAFATDFKRHFSTAEMNPLIELQQLHNFDMHIVHVSEEDELTQEQKQNKEVLEKMFDNVTIENILKENGISKAINSYTEKNNIQLIGLLKYQHSFIEKLTHEPVIRKISFRSSVPLLIIHV